MDNIPQPLHDAQQGDFLLPDLPRRYRKPALSEDALLARWRERGLVISDPDRALRYLRHLGYYRISAYVRSFETSTRDVIRPGVSFDDVLRLYVFDRQLRLHMLDALERVEVAVRAAISDHMSLSGGPHWYEDSGHFTHRPAHQHLLHDIDDMLRLQHARRAETDLGGDRFASALDHYVANYDEPSRPPTWIVFEELSFGRTRAVYDSLADRQVRSSIARSLGVMPPVLSSWLKSYQRVRNICAHHGRLWNRGLGVYPMIPKSRHTRWLDDPTPLEEPWRRQRLFPVMVSLQTVLHTISPRSTWGQRLNGLLDATPAVPLHPMGVPDGWFDDPFWSTEPSSSPHR